MLISFRICLLIALISALPLRAGAETLRFTACGKANLAIFQLSTEAPDAIEEVWRWVPAEYEGLPDDAGRLFRHIDECWPLEGGSKILITSSTDGVGIVDRAKRQFHFVGEATNAHSAALTPGGNIAVAASKGGDELILFDKGSVDHRLASAPLKLAHGVLWDARRRRLIALGDERLAIFKIIKTDDQGVRLKETKSFSLPEAGGHNLSWGLGRESLFISTASCVWLFDLSTDEFSHDPNLSQSPYIKSVSVNAAGDVILWVQADQEKWWSDAVHLTAAQRTYTLPVGMEIYKARWFGPSEASHP